MKKKLGFPEIIGNWLKGLWSKFSRWLNRQLRPKQGKRNQVMASSNGSPLSGVGHFRSPESLTVQELMAKVQWHLPKQAPKTVSTVKEEINWD